MLTDYDKSDNKTQEQHNILMVYLLFIGMCTGGFNYLTAELRADYQSTFPLFRRSPISKQRFKEVIEFFNLLGTALTVQLIGFTIYAFGYKYGYMMIILIIFFLALIPFWIIHKETTGNKGKNKGNESISDYGNNTTGTINSDD